MHGLFQNGTAHVDGPAFVTQCPIGPVSDLVNVPFVYPSRALLFQIPGANSFPYEMPLRDSEQTGTFWYHAHLSSQYVDGLRGALIVYGEHLLFA
jgi:iron transport multicopper oxidase